MVVVSVSRTVIREGADGPVRPETWEICKKPREEG